MLPLLERTPCYISIQDFSLFPRISCSARFWVDFLEYCILIPSRHICVSNAQVICHINLGHQTFIKATANAYFTFFADNVTIYNCLLYLEILIHMILCTYAKLVTTIFHSKENNLLLMKVFSFIKSEHLFSCSERRMRTIH